MVFPVVPQRGMMRRPLPAMASTALCLHLVSAQPHPLFQPIAASEEEVRIRTVSWNIAGVNNNPFEYWMTHPDPTYKSLMEAVEQFIVAPGEDDVPVHSVFSDAMVDRLLGEMKAANLAPQEHLDLVSTLWKEEVRERRVVSGFMQDKLIGDKRLASMPDRVTNTILAPGKDAVYRPTVINCYDGDMSSLESWYQQWLDFFFRKEVDLGKGATPVYKLLQKIKKAKYPAIREEEEEASIPLQLLFQGVFDAILVDFMLKRGTTVWQPLRRGICDSLNKKKFERVKEILATTYAEADVVFLQEVGNQLVQALRETFGESYHIVTPGSFDLKRGQNSVMMLCKDLMPTWEEVSLTESTDGWGDGDLLTVKTTIGGLPITLGSFHGDTNGLLTPPLVTKVATKKPTDLLLMGLDANVYRSKSKKTQHIDGFLEVYKSFNLESSWGTPPDESLHTTYHGRTYLQPQLNKAVKSTELKEKGDIQPKDYILFTSNKLKAVKAWRDNTGSGEFIGEMVFPTLQFPSDHALIAADLRLSPTKQEL
mmetsp:Transcript_63785/g.138709  ORF Transcript_63785/g.138709 Transcript_63785/m.138709 type:complete len:537 (-) Transcript_63785:26-1636(-)